MQYTCLHVSHLILYPQPFFSHFPSPDVLQGKQSSLLHPLFLRGSGLARCFRALPARSWTTTLISVTSSNFRHTSFIFPVRGPADGSMINGAETWPALVWCHVFFFCSFANLLSFSFHSLGRCTGLTPTSSSPHILSHFSRAVLITWCLNLIKLQN